MYAVVNSRCSSYFFKNIWWILFSSILSTAIQQYLKVFVAIKLYNYDNSFVKIHSNRKFIKRHSTITLSSTSSWSSTTQSSTYHQCYSVLVAVLCLLLILITPVSGGSCWSSMMRNGRCTELLSERVSKEECCASDSVTTAYSKEDLDPGTLFFWRVLGGGVPCSTCKQTCAGVQCGEGKKCVQRKSGPKCVCSPECKANNGGSRGPVCGTDGRSYRTLCRLRKRACRRKSHTLSVAYYGHCQSSCDKIECPPGKHCLVDQNLSPHCVKCARNCTSPMGGNPRGRQVCGADGITYQSACHLREAACQKGKAIPVAYKGRCKQAATCGNVRCKERQSCLSDITTGSPRCVTCSARCPRVRSHMSPNGGLGSDSPRRKNGNNHSANDMGGPICGTNNRTYHSWCHMLKDACATGYIIETKHSGSCHQRSSSATTFQHHITTVANVILEKDPIS